MTRYSRILMFSAKYTFFCVVAVILLLLIGMFFKRRQRGTFIFFVILAIISSIRVNAGSDYFNYYSNYISVTYYYENLIKAVTSRYQFGIVALDYTIQRLIGTSNGIFLVISIVVSVFTWIIFLRYSSFPRISASVWLLSGFYLISNNLLKQYIAMMLMMIGYFCLRRKHFILFILFTLLASTFHVTALLVAPLYFLSTYIVPSKKTLLTSCIVGGILLVVVYPILSVLVKISLFSRYEQYLESAATISGRFIAISIIMFVFYLLAILVYLNDINNLTTESKQYISLLLFGILLLIVSIRFFYLSRFAYYFLQFLPLLVSNGFNNKINNSVEKRKLRGWLLVSLVVYCFMFTAFSGENNYYNYSTVFNDVPVSVQDFIGR